MDKKSDFQKTFNLIMDSVEYIQKVNNDKEMDKAYIDEYTTRQQRLRDKKITELLEHYVNGYKYKTVSNKWYKGILVSLCALILVAFCVAFLFFICNIDLSKDNSSLGSVVELVSVCVTFLTLIVGILQTITKYVFPEKEEEYITRIVEIIQNNDLENKKENIRAQITQAIDSEKIKITQIDEMK